MWANPQNQPPIEKIRKATWTEENTAKTQDVVDRLAASRLALIRTLGGHSKVTDDLVAAMERFRQLDGGVVLPERKG